MEQIKPHKFKEMLEVRNPRKPKENQNKMEAWKACAMFRFVWLATLYEVWTVRFGVYTSYEIIVCWHPNLIHRSKKQKLNIILNDCKASIVGNM